MRSRDSSGQSGVLVLLGVLFTIILAGLDNTIVSTVIPVALPELGGAHLYAWTFAAYILPAAVSMPIWGPGRIDGTPAHLSHRDWRVHGRERTLRGRAHDDGDHRRSCHLGHRSGSRGDSSVCSKIDVSYERKD